MSFCPIFPYFRATLENSLFLVPDRPKIRAFCKKIKKILQYFFFFSTDRPIFFKKYFREKAFLVTWPRLDPRFVLEFSCFWPKTFFITDMNLWIIFVYSKRSAYQPFFTICDGFFNSFNTLFLKNCMFLIKNTYYASPVVLHQDFFLVFYQLFFKFYNLPSTHIWKPFLSDSKISTFCEERTLQVYVQGKSWIFWYVNL